MTNLERITPVLRVFDEAKAREFYIDFLGFNLIFEHRYEENFPVYMGLSLGNCHIHLTEHHGDASPGAAIRIAIDDVDSYCKALKAKDYKFSKPEVGEETPWGSKDMTIIDPFGNRLTFSQAV